ncbi:MAG: RNA methyltransferase [Prevotellaceae bacterium]|jgi:TrmH family RNA methyltransferase|nr:RNA methyltransferase [Prevotellaceae bacterium]
MTQAEIKWIKSLATKKRRDEEGVFVVEGEKMTDELRQSGFTVRRLVATHPLPYTIPQLTPEYVDEKTMQRISLLKTPTPVLAVVEKPVGLRWPAFERDELIIALDQVQDPGNAGTIIRTADWFGVRHVVCSPGTVDCYSPKVVQATMGAIFRVHIYTAVLPAFLRQAKSHTTVYGAFLHGENLYRRPLTAGGVVVIGNEGRGISPDVAAEIATRLCIPAFPGDGGGSESLNAAVSAAIVCAEFRRRAKYPVTMFNK